MPKGIYDKNKYHRGSKPNELITKGDISFIIIPNKNGKEKARIIVDTADLSKLIKYRWGVEGRYARSAYMIDKSKFRFYLHHLLVPKKKGFEVDHINRNKFDNRRVNLRYLNRTNNLLNNGAIGVEVKKLAKGKFKYKPYLNVDKQSIKFKRFNTFEEAKKAREEYKNMLFHVK